MSPKKLIVFIVVPFLLTVALLLVQLLSTPRFHLGGKAVESLSFDYEEQTIPALQSNALSLEAEVSTFGNPSGQDLPITGTWEGRIIKIVPQDYFQDALKNSGGISAIQMMNDGRLFLGAYNALAVKSLDDSNWEHLTYYRLNLPRSTSIDYFVQTQEGSYDVYFGYDKVVRMKADNSFELVADPTDPIGYLRDVTIIPYAKVGAVAYRENELYYLEKGKLRKWLTPKRGFCGNRDKILVMFTDSVGSGKTYGLIEERFTTPSCQAQYETRLYQFEFSSDRSIPLKTVRLGKVVNAQSLSKAVLNVRFENPTQKLLYGSAKYINKLFLIPYFYDDGREMTMTSYNIDPEIPGPFSFTAELGKSNLSDNLWFAASEVKGIYLGRNFDSATSTGYFTRTENTNLLANPYINSLTHDNNQKVYTAHHYLPGQFNNGLVTILEVPSSPLPTPTCRPPMIPARIAGPYRNQEITETRPNLGIADYSVPSTCYPHDVIFNIWQNGVKIRNSGWKEDVITGSGQQIFWQMGKPLLPGRYEWQAKLKNTGEGVSHTLIIPFTVVTPSPSLSP